MTETETRELIRRRMQGFTGYCGIVIETTEGGLCRAHIDIEPRHRNPRGYVHGGLMSTLMDVAAGSAAISACEPPRMMVTQSAEIHYLRPAAGEGRLTADARSVKAGRSVAFVQVDVTDETGKLVAVGSFELFYLPDSEKP